MNFGADLSFLEHCEAFIEPEVTPILTGDLIAGPRVSNLVSSDVHLRFVRSDNCWRGKRE